MVNDWDTNKEYSYLASKALTDCTRSYLGLSEEEDLYSLMDAFSGKVEQTFFGHVETLEVPCEVSPEDRFKDLEYICSNYQANANCTSYCNMIRIDTTIQKKLRQVFQWALYTSGPLTNRNPHSLLPVCKHPESDLETKCLEPIINHYGNCFVSRNGIKLAV